MAKITENQRNECEAVVNQISEGLDEFETQLMQRAVTAETLLNYLDDVETNIRNLRQKVEEING